MNNFKRKKSIEIVFSDYTFIESIKKKLKDAKIHFQEGDLAIENLMKELNDLAELLDVDLIIDEVQKEVDRLLALSVINWEQEEISTQEVNNLNIVNIWNDKYIEIWGEVYKILWEDIKWEKVVIEQDGLLALYDIKSKGFIEKWYQNIKFYLFWETRVAHYFKEWKTYTINLENTEKWIETYEGIEVVENDKGQAIFLRENQDGNKEIIDPTNWKTIVTVRWNKKCNIDLIWFLDWKPIFIYTNTSRCEQFLFAFGKVATKKWTLLSEYDTRNLVIENWELKNKGYLIHALFGIKYKEISEKVY